MEEIKVRLLGGFEVFMGDGAPILFDSDKHRALFAYLVISVNHTIRRESLAGLFWPEKSEAAARHSLSQAIYALRRPFHKHLLSDPFEITPQTVQLRIKELFGLDMYAFDQLSRGCEKHKEHKQVNCQACLENLAQACGLYKGDFCSGLSLKECEKFEDWLRLHCEIYGLKYIKILDELVLGCSETGNVETALIYAYQRVFQDPYDENGQLQLIRLLVRQGQRGKAMAQYERYRRMLDIEANRYITRDMRERFDELALLELKAGSVKPVG